jgi:class 3 adenylate cyclase
VEEMNKTYGTSILLTETVYRRLRQPERFAVRFLDNVTVKGKSMPIAVYEALIATTTD